MNFEYKQPDKITNREINRISTLLNKVETCVNSSHTIIGNYMFFRQANFEEHDLNQILFKMLYPYKINNWSEFSFFSLHFTPQIKEIRSANQYNPELHWMHSKELKGQYFCIELDDINTKQRSALSRFYACLGCLKLIELAADKFQTDKVVITTMNTDPQVIEFFCKLGFYSQSVTTDYPDNNETYEYCYFTHEPENLVRIKNTTIEYLARLIRKYPFLLWRNPTISDLSEAD